MTPVPYSVPDSLRPLPALPGVVPVSAEGGCPAEAEAKEAPDPVLDFVMFGTVPQ
jgi:hypothetical protein